MKTRPTHPSCRDSVGLLAPRYMDGFGQAALASCQTSRSLALSRKPCSSLPLLSIPALFLRVLAISTRNGYLSHWVSVTSRGA